MKKCPECCVYRNEYDFCHIDTCLGGRYVCIKCSAKTARIISLVSSDHWILGDCDICKKDVGTLIKYPCELDNLSVFGMRVIENYKKICKNCTESSPEFE